MLHVTRVQEKLNTVVNKLEGKGGVKPMQHRQQGLQQQKGGSTTQKQGQFKKNPVSPVEQSQYTLEMSAQQRKLLAASVTKRGTTTAYVDQKARMPRSVKYKHSQQQHNTEIISWVTACQCASMQMSTALRLLLSRA